MLITILLKTRHHSLVYLVYLKNKLKIYQHSGSTNPHLPHQKRFLPKKTPYEVLSYINFYIKCNLPKCYICDALHDLVPLVHSKKRENYPWRSVTFNKVAG